MAKAGLINQSGLFYWSATSAPAASPSPARIEYQRAERQVYGERAQEALYFWSSPFYYDHQSGTCPGASCALYTDNGNSFTGNISCPSHGAGCHQRRVHGDLTRIVLPNAVSIVEEIRYEGFTYRFEADNLLDHENCRERRRFNGYLRDGDLREIERFCTTNGVRVTLKVRATF